MLQKCALQTAVPIEVSARLAQHTVDEAKRYAANSSYEMSDITAAPLKLVRTQAAHTCSTSQRTCVCVYLLLSCKQAACRSSNLLSDGCVRRQALSGPLPRTRCQCRCLLAAESTACRLGAECRMLFV